MRIRILISGHSTEAPNPSCNAVCSRKSKPNVSKEYRYRNWNVSKTTTKKEIKKEKVESCAQTEELRKGMRKEGKVTGEAPRQKRKRKRGVPGA